MSLDTRSKNPCGGPHWDLAHYKKKENVTLTLHFLLPLFDTPTWHVLSRVAMKEKTQLFLAYMVYLCLFVRVIFVICLLKMY